MDVLRSTLQPITHNLPESIKDVFLNLLGPKCYTHLILDLDPIGDLECTKLALSKGLGIAIVGASAVVKIPQLVKLIHSHSSAGVSFLSYLLETISFLVTLTYNARSGNPFSTYGESALIALQNVAIASLVLHYAGKSAGAAAFVAGLAASVYALFEEKAVDMKTLSMLQAGAGVLGVASKVPQIVTIWQQGGTGQLSAFTVFNYLFGSLTRIFTTIQEVNDPLILYGFVAGFALNAVLAAQMVYYWNLSAPSTRNTKSKRVGRKALEEPMATGSDARPRAKGPSTRRRA